MRKPSLRRRRAAPPLLATAPPPPPPSPPPPSAAAAAAPRPARMAAYLAALGARMRRLAAPPTTSFAHSYAGEFDALLDADRRAAREVARFSAGATVEAAQRNRYSNVLANDHSRVRLCGGGGCDYVNANRVAGEAGGYIATQAPTAETFAHFWQMVHESGACVIVMLTREVEGRGGGVVKSDRYWPEPGAEARYGGYTVRCVSEAGVGYPIVERRFEVVPPARAGGRGVLAVTHLQYVDWPDQDVPESPRGLLDLRLRAARYNHAARAPVVVHCSAGVGRTGTYIAVDQTLRRVRCVYGEGDGEGEGGGGGGGGTAGNGECVEDIYDCVFALKLARSKMVQTWEQYRFIFHAVHAGVEAMVAGADLADQPFARRRTSATTDDDDPAGSAPALQLNNVLPTAAAQSAGERPQRPWL